MITIEQIGIFWNVLKACNRAKTQRETESIIQDAIERYEQSKWISVKDRMPDDRIEVLVIQRYENSKMRIDWALDGYFVTYPNITHWMPLPEFEERSDESNR